MTAVLAALCFVGTCIEIIQRHFYRHSRHGYKQQEDTVVDNSTINVVQEDVTGITMRPVQFDPDSK